MPNVPLFPGFTRTIGQTGLTADMNAVAAQVAALTAYVNSLTGGGGSVAATPTGSYNATTRTYTVNIGSYPLSRLRVSVNYAAFVAATTLSYAVGNTYRAPEYFRFKIAAEGTEAESAVLGSPGFPAPGAYTPIPTLLQGLIQSNGVGYGHIADVPPERRVALPKARINKFQLGSPNTTTIVDYQLLVSDEGIRRSVLESLGITDPRYQDGHGLDFRYAERIQASGVEGDDSEKVQQPGRDGGWVGIQQVDGCSTARTFEEYDLAEAALNAQGKTMDVIGVVLDVKESEASNANYAAEAHAMLNAWEAAGKIKDTTKRLIMMAYAPTNYSQIRALQEQLYAIDPSKYVKIDIAPDGPLSGTIDGVHLNSAQQILAGDAVYDALHGVVTPPANTPTITDFNPKVSPPGYIVYIVGTNFVSGQTQVYFGGAQATTVAVDSATLIRATVPVGAQNGTLKVVTPNGEVEVSGYYIEPQPIAASATFTHNDIDASTWLPDSTPGQYLSGSSRYTNQYGTSALVKGKLSCTTAATLVGYANSATGYGVLQVELRNQSTNVSYAVNWDQAGPGEPASLSRPGFTLSVPAGVYDLFILKLANDGKYQSIDMFTWTLS